MIGTFREGGKGGRGLLNNGRKSKYNYANQVSENVKMPRRVSPASNIMYNKVSWVRALKISVGFRNMTMARIVLKELGQEK